MWKRLRRSLVFLLPHYPPPTGSADEWPAAYPPGGLLFYGDNKEVLATLVKDFRGKVKLIYIDPPFDSGADYVRKVQLRGGTNVGALEGEEQSLLEQVQYSDIWANDSYLQFMYERLLLLKELLAEDGSIYLHCDTRKSHHLRCLLDEVFGMENFGSEIVWQSADAQSSANRYGPIHNTIFYYTRSDQRIWNDVRVPLSKATADTWYTHEELAKEDITNRLGVLIPKGTVRRYNMSDLTARKPGGDTKYEWKGIVPPSGRSWAYSRENMERFESVKLIAYSGSGRPYLKRFLDEVEGTLPQDLWTDISMLRGINNVEAKDYPTQKPEALLTRILRVSSNPGDLVLDCFIGSGTTAAVAQKLGRRWIGCDINKGAIQTTSRRLQQIITEQGEVQARPRQGKLADEADTAVPAPAQLAFTVHRVNDYDLAIQHNELAALVGQQLGITRLPTDGFFDGTGGANLVKIVPFDHAVGPLDLEAAKEELLRRPEELRGVTVVALGKQLAADAWLADWNQYRAVAKLGEDNRPVEFVNTIEIIDLRTDARHGGFIAHQPASADVVIAREGETVCVTVEDVISPTIVQRLQLDLPLFQAKITDWRAVVNSVEIDTHYDGAVFTIALSDIPERKSDLVVGDYTLPAPSAPTTVAVKITDMLGEEILVTKKV